MPRIGVVGATGAVGTVTLELLAERGYDDVRAFASARSAGSRIAFGGQALVVEEATPEALAAGDLDVCLFSVGTSRSLELVPHAVRGGAIAVDKSSAYRLADGVPLVVPEVNGARAVENDGIVANPNCCTIPLTCVLKPLHEAAGLRRVRVATYQSMSGAGASNMQRLARDPAPRARPADGVGIRRRGVRRGDQAPRGNAEDHGAAGAADQRELRPRAGDGRPRGDGVGRDRVAALCRRGPFPPRCGAEHRTRRLSVAREGRGRGRRPRRSDPPGSDRVRTDSSSSSPATTFARAPRSTRSRSRSSWSGAKHWPPEAYGLARTGTGAGDERLLQRRRTSARSPSAPGQAAELEPRQLHPSLDPQGRGSRSRRGSPAGTRSGGRGSARRSTRPRGTGTRTPPAPSRRGPSRRRSRPGRATASPTACAASTT